MEYRKMFDSFLDEMSKIAAPLLKRPPANFPADMTFAGQPAPPRPSARPTPTQTTASGTYHLVPAKKRAPEKMVESHGRQVPQHSERRERYEQVMRRMAARQGGGYRAPGPTGRPTEAGVESIKKKVMPAVQKDPSLMQPLRKHSSAQAFLDELEKVAKKKGFTAGFQHFVHNPLTQAFGYGALAAEGAHALADMSKSPRLRSAAHSKWGTRAGKGAIGAGATFLALEGMSALLDSFRKKTASPGAPKGHPDYKTFKKNAVPLTPEERKKVMDAKAVWHHAPGGGPSPAVHKAVIDGKTWFETHTHRAINYAPTVEGAISRYHKFIKGTA